MLQYILSHSERFSAAELAQMAIEGGCDWICVRMPELTDDELNMELVSQAAEKIITGDEAFQRSMFGTKDGVSR